MLIGTMLFCDAWFDVGTSLATSGFVISLLSALFAELPLALLAFVGAWRLLKATVAAGILSGQQVDAGYSLRRTPLAGHGLDEALPRGRAERRAERAGRARQSA